MPGFSPRGKMKTVFADDVSLALIQTGRKPREVSMRHKATMVAVLTTVMIFMLSFPAPADDAATAQALVEKGVKTAQVAGIPAALRAIGDPDGPFIVGDFYLFAGPLDKITLSAHPYRPLLVGPDLSTFKNSQMFSFIVEFVKVASEAGSGWVEYRWPKPGAEEPSLKRTYIMRVPGENLYIGCGYYPPATPSPPRPSPALP